MNMPSTPIPLRADPGALFSSQRRSFVRAVTSMVLAEKCHETADRVLTRNWRDDATALRIVKTATTPTVSADLPWMTTTVVLPMLAPQSASAQLLALATQVNMSGVVTVSLPFIGQSGRPVTPFVAEGRPMPVVDLTVSPTVLGPTKQLLIGSALTHEVQNGSGDVAATIIGSALEVSTRQSMDALLFSNAAATASAPGGILSGVTAIPSAGKTGVEGAADDLALLASDIASNGINSDDMTIVTTPALATKLRCLLSPKFTNTVLSTSSLPSGQVVAIARNGLAVGYDGSITVEITKEPAVHFEDSAPTDISAAGTVAYPTKSIWQVDGLVVKVRGWCSWVVHPGAVAYVTGAAF